jgi:hypothetical protein
MNIWRFGKLLVVGFLALNGAESVAWADRVSIERATGKLLEYQSAATPGTLVANAVRAGYAEDHVEEREVTAQEWQALREAQIDAPARAVQAQLEGVRRQKEQAMRAKLGLTPQEFDDLREALR